MNARFIDKCHFIIHYEKKEGTKTSFYQVAGRQDVLPNRISWGINAICKDSNKLKGKKNEINGQYRKAEVGFYKHLNHGKIHSSVWGHSNFPEFYGYGIIDERHGVYDLLIFYSDNQCMTSIEIHLFRGLGKPEYLEETFSWLRHQRKSPNKGALGDIL